MAEKKEVKEEKVEEKVETKQNEERRDTRRDSRGKKRSMDDNVVYVGKKGVMNYVMATITQMNKGEKEIHVKARGRSISKAVDIVQLLKNRFETGTRIKGIEIGTDEVEADEGGTINVSTIDITVEK